MSSRLRPVLLVVIAILSLSSAVLHGSASSRDRGSRSFVKRHGPARLHLQADLKKLLSRPEPFTYPAARLNVREKRSDDSDGQCGLDSSAALEIGTESLSETAEAIQAVWVDKDRILIVASDADRDTTTIWLGTLRSIGIFSFSSHPNLITEAVAPSSLQVSDTHRRRAVVVSKNNRHLYVSSDGGRQWNKVSLPSDRFDESSDLYLSEVDPDHMFLVAMTETKWSELFHTHNAGQQWERAAEQVQLVKFAVSNRQSEFVFYLSPGRHPRLNHLNRMNIISGETDVLDKHAYRFAVDGRYLFVSRQNFTGSSVSDASSRLLYVCSDFATKLADVEFNEVQLPSVTPEQFYVIMATHESGAFIHVSLDRDKPAGGLYVSDSSGTRFSLSLPNHFYKTYHVHLTTVVITDLDTEASSWHYSVDDFYEVRSMRGVYITTAVVGGASTKDTPTDASHVTMITFNNGGEWQRLRPPDSTPHCHYPSCSLHLHLHYSRMIAHHYNQSYSNGLLSVETAVGIIIGHGSIGSTRNDSAPRLVLSNDGGYSWMDPGLPVGTYVYGIADYGNVIAVALDVEHVEYIWFSHDRGECFVKQLLDSTQAFSLSRGLLMDPRAASLTGFVMGVEGVGKDDEWRMITLNFKTLLQRKCMPTDYSSWTEHGSSDSCLLGYKDTYNLTKGSAICYNEQGYKYKPVSRVRCACTYDDLECDYGYNRTDVSTCSKMKGYDLSRQCPPGAKLYNSTKSGFRLIPGDQCQPTDTSRRELATELLPCTGHEKDAGFDNTHEKKRDYTSPGKIVGGIIIALVIIAIASVAFYGFIRCREKGPETYEKVLYQKLPTTAGRFSATEESSDEDLITPSSTNPFQD